MYTFLTVAVAVCVILGMLLLVVLVFLQTGFWICYDDSKKRDIFPWLLFCFSLIGFYDGIELGLPVISIITGIILLSQFFFFDNHWREFEHNAFTKKTFLVMTLSFMLLMVMYGVTENYRVHYRWNNSSVFTVSKIEQDVVRENNYEIVGTEQPAAVLLGKVDVRKYYIRLSNGERLEVQDPQSYHIGDTVHIFRNEMVQKP